MTSLSAAASSWRAYPRQRTAPRPWRERLPNAIFALLPVAYLLPPVLSLGGIRINWYEVFLWPIFLCGWRHRANRVVLALLGVALGTALSTILAVDNFGLSPSLKDFALIKYTLSYVAALQLGLHLSRERLERRSVIPLLCLILLALVSIAAVTSESVRTTIGNLYGSEGAYSTQAYEMRLVLIGTNPMLLGSTATILFFLASLGSARFHWPLFLLALVPILLAQQRVSLGLIVLLVMLSKYLLHRRVPVVRYLVAFVLCYSAWWLVTQHLPSRYVGRLSERRLLAGWEGRMQPYREQWQVFTQYPVTGTGRLMEHRWEVVDARTPGRRVEPHSQYMGILSETGLIGLIPLALLVMTIVKTSRTALRHGRADDTTLSFVAVTAVYLVSMVPWEALYFPPWSVFFFFTFGALLSQSTNRLRTRPLRKRYVWEPVTDGSTTGSPKPARRTREELLRRTER